MAITPEPSLRSIIVILPRLRAAMHQGEAAMAAKNLHRTGNK
jgi:hypothetical protein